MALALAPLDVVGQATLPGTQPAPATSQPAAYTTQVIWFGRSQETITVELAPTRQAMDRAGLLAFGRTWAEASKVRKQGIKWVAEFEIPQVRMPTVFRIANPDWPNQIMGELVAYPGRDVEWDYKITLYSCGAPAWFGQWASATGLAVKAIADGDMSSAVLAPVEENGTSLLIAGQGAAVRDLAGMAALAAKKKVNLLVLDAACFGQAAGKPVSVSPAQMLGGMARLAKQQWPQPLKFSSHRKPWPGIVNRWAWIVDEHGLPLVEDVHLASFMERVRLQQEVPSSFRVVLSYLPWPQQLGRNESADAALQALLAAAAQPRGTLRWKMLDILHPSPAAITDAERPILAAAGRAWPMLHDSPSRIYVFDFRGEQSPPREVETEFARLEKQPAWGPGPGLLILGDDPILDQLPWLKLDRQKGVAGRPEVLWLPNDELPPSADNQIRMMIQLTELGVPLMPPMPEENQK